MQNNHITKTAGFSRIIHKVGQKLVREATHFPVTQCLRPRNSKSFRLCFYFFILILTSAANCGRGGGFFLINTFTLSIFFS